MDPLDPEHAEPELDALLRAHRPRPDADWVRATQQRLLPPPKPSRMPVLRWPAPPLRLGAAFATGLAGLMLALSLAGVGPLADQNQPVQADDECRTIEVTRTERVPRIVTVAGEPRIVYRPGLVQRYERRCR